MFLIPLNDENLPASKFMTEELLESLSKTNFIHKNKNLIELHPLYNEFSNLSLKEQKKIVEGFMSNKLSKKYDKILQKNNSISLSRNRRSKSLTRNKISNSLTRNRRSKSLTRNRISKSLTRKNTPIFNNFQGPLVSVMAGGSFSDSFGTIISTIMFIFIILLYFNPNLQNVFSLEYLRGNLEELVNISTSKNAYRLVFIVITNSENYFLKIAVSDLVETKEDAQDFDIQYVKYNDVGEYVYECLMYDEMNKNIGVEYNGRDLSTYVSEIVDWNIKNINDESNRDNFNVNIEGQQFNLNILTTFEGNSYKLCNIIRNVNNWSKNMYAFPKIEHYCYSIVKEYNGFTTLRNYIRDRSFDNLLNILGNACNILHLFYDEKQFCHWDLHGENILVNGRTGEIKLFDFDFSTVYYTKSIAYDGRLEFISNQKVLLTTGDIFGHLYDYYRLIYENIIYYPAFNDYFISISGIDGKNGKFSDLVDYLVANNVLKRNNQNHFTDMEVKQAHQMFLSESKYNSDTYYKNFYETLLYFNSIA